MKDIDEPVERQELDHRAAHEMDGGGNLVPDLPEPDETVMSGNLIGWDVGDHLVQYAPRTNTVIIGEFYGKDIRLDPTEARKVAYAMLAAVSYAERTK